MSQRIMFHGGPLHGKVMTVPHNRDRVTVGGKLPDVETHEADDEGPGAMQVGEYSRVADCGDNFEWDGWIRP